MDVISFSIVYLVPVSVYAGYLLGGMYTFITPVFIFVIVPILDIIIGKDTRNPDAETEKALETDIRYKLLTMVCAPLQMAVDGIVCALGAGTCGGSPSAGRHTGGSGNSAAGRIFLYLLAPNCFWRVEQCLGI